MECDKKNMVGPKEIYRMALENISDDLDAVVKVLRRLEDDEEGTDSQMVSLCRTACDGINRRICEVMKDFQ